jgi:hypothetical protein
MRVFWTIVVFTLIIPFTDAAFEDVIPSPRAMAMGEVASTMDDGSLLIWNPSAASRVKGMEVLTSYLALYPGLELNLYSGERERLGYHLLTCSSSVGSNQGIGAGWLSFRSALYVENILSLAYSAEVRGRLRVGCALKLLNRGVRENEYTRVDPRLSGIELSRNAMTFDLGVTLRVKSLRLGMAIVNVYPSDIGFISRELIPLSIRIGVAHVGETYLQVGELRIRDGKVGFGFGFERRFFRDVLALRIGASDEMIGLGWGYELLLGGYNLGFDYAFAHPISQLRGTYGSHLLSVRLCFP